MRSASTRPMLLLALLIGMLAAVDAHAISDAWTQDNSLLAMTPEAGAGYGAAISVDGDVLAIGQPRATVGGVSGAGSVDVWRRQASGWVREATLVESESVANAHFGATVQVRGDTLYVGAPDRLGGTISPHEGAFVAFIYDSGNGMWEPSYAYFGAASGERFGAAIAAQGDLFAASSPGSSTLFPGGYVSTRYGDTMSFTTLTEPSSAAGDNFGASVALYRSVDPAEPDIAVIGAPNYAFGSAGPSNGAVYVFSNSTHVATDWQLVTMLYAPNRNANQFFGLSVALAPGILIVGAPGSNKTTGTPVSAAGSVFVFVANGGGGWTQQSEIFLSTAATGDGFGARVAYDASTGRIFAGAPGRTTNVFGGTGPTGIVAVLRYKRIVNFLFDWADTADLESQEFDSISQSAGSSIAVSQGTAFVGAPDYDGAGTATNSGRVLVFTADEIFSNGFD